MILRATQPPHSQPFDSILPISSGSFPSPLSYAFLTACIAVAAIAGSITRQAYLHRDDLPSLSDLHIRAICQHSNARQRKLTSFLALSAFAFLSASASMVTAES